MKKLVWILVGIPVFFFVAGFFGLTIWYVVATNRANALYNNFQRLEGCHFLVEGRFYSACRIQGITTQRQNFDRGDPSEFIESAALGLEAELAIPGSSLERISHYYRVILSDTSEPQRKVSTRTEQTT